MTAWLKHDSLKSFNGCLRRRSSENESLKSRLIFTLNLSMGVYGSRLMRIIIKRTLKPNPPASHPRQEKSVETNSSAINSFIIIVCYPRKKKERKSLRGAEKRSFSCSARESHWSFICLEMVAEKRTDYLRTTPLPRSLARVGSFWVKFVSMIVYFTIIIRVSTSR